MVANWKVQFVLKCNRATSEEKTPMQRRDFLKSTVAVAAAAELAMGKAQAKVPAHNWGNYDFGSGPAGDRSPESGSVPSIPT